MKKLLPLLLVLLLPALSFGQHLALSARAYQAPPPPKVELRLQDADLAESGANLAVTGLAVNMVGVLAMVFAQDIAFPRDSVVDPNKARNTFNQIRGGGALLMVGGIGFTAAGVRKLARAVAQD
jgi:hypothetical protein